MAKRINVKLILELNAGGLTQNEIAVSRHFSKTSVSLVCILRRPVATGAFASGHPALAVAGFNQSLSVQS